MRYERSEYLPTRMRTCVRSTATMMPVSTTPIAESAGGSRVKRPPRADERTTILAFLQWHRETLELKCSGLTPAQLAEPAVGSSSLSLLGLLRHAAESEQ